MMIGIRIDDNLQRITACNEGKLYKLSLRRETIRGNHMGFTDEKPRLEGSREGNGTAGKRHRDKHC